MTRAATILLVVCTTAACNDRERECGERGNNANVSGTWRLEAEGERKDCPAGDERAKVKLASVRALEVTQAGSAAQIDVVSLATPIAGFTFSGTVEGGCVDFDTHETDAGTELGFSFAGHIDGTVIDGDFSETTAQSCRTEGSFTVEISPYPFVPNDDGGPQQDGATPDGEATDGGDSTPGDAGEGDGDAAPLPRECYTASECDHGDCIDYRCVDLCEVNTDCLVGETCVDGRCEEAPGCGCRGGGGGPGGVVVLLGVFWRRRRRLDRRRSRNRPPGRS